MAKDAGRLNPFDRKMSNRVCDTGGVAGPTEGKGAPRVLLQVLILRLEDLRLLIEKDLRLARYARVVARDLGCHRSGEGINIGERLRASSS
jgi:hypothetical protein